MNIAPPEHPGNPRWKTQAEWTRLDASHPIEMPAPPINMDDIVQDEEGWGEPATREGAAPAAAGGGGGWNDTNNAGGWGNSGWDNSSWNAAGTGGWS